MSRLFDAQHFKAVDIFGIDGSAAPLPIRIASGATPDTSLTSALRKSCPIKVAIVGNTKQTSGRLRYIGKNFKMRKRSVKVCKWACESLGKSNGNLFVRGRISHFRGMHTENESLNTKKSLAGYLAQRFRPKSDLFNLKNNNKFGRGCCRDYISIFDKSKWSYLKN